MTGTVAQQVFAVMSAEEWKRYEATLRMLVQRYRNLPADEAHARRCADLTDFMLTGFCRGHDGCGPEEGRGENAFS